MEQIADNLEDWRNSVWKKSSSKSNQSRTWLLRCPGDPGVSQCPAPSLGVTACGCFGVFLSGIYFGSLFLTSGLSFVNSTIHEIFFSLNELPVDIFKFISKLISFVNQDTVQFSFPCSKHHTTPGLLFRIDKHQSTDSSFSTNSSRSKVWRGNFVAVFGHGPWGWVPLTQPLPEAPSAFGRRKFHGAAQTSGISAA